MDTLLGLRGLRILHESKTKAKTREAMKEKIGPQQTKDRHSFVYRMF